MLKNISIRGLTKVAVGLGCASIITSYNIDYFIQKKYRKTKTYQKVIEIFENHDATVKHLGEPIEIGKIRIFGDEDPRKIYIKLKGSKTSGTLKSEYVVKPDKKTDITKVEVSFKDVPNKLFVIHEI